MSRLGKRIFLFIFLFLMSSAASVHESASQEANRRVALVIANSAYPQQLGALSNTHLDGDIIARALSGIGFDVTLVRDANVSDFREHLLSFIKKLRQPGPRPVAFFYFSGHGAADTSMFGENFLIPVGAPIQDAAELRARAVGLQDVIKAIEATDPLVSFVVLDACRNVAFPSSSKSIAKGLVAVDKSIGMLIAYATRPGETAADNNVYAKALAAALELPGIDATSTFKEAQIRTAEASGRRQVPWTEDGLLDRYVFRPARAPVAANPPVPVTPTPAPVVPKPVPPEASPQIAMRPPEAIPPLPPAAPQSAPTRPTPASSGSLILTRIAGQEAGRAGRLALPAADAVVLQSAVPATTTKSLIQAGGPAGPSSALRVTATEVGRVQSVSIEPISAGDRGVSRPAYFYVAATAAFGLPIARKTEGEIVALDRGEAGAEWHPGLFGPGGGPGTIWRIDAVTGASRLFASADVSGVANAGAGLGQIVVDSRTRQLLAADRDSGMIHRFALDGASLGTYDHGTKGRPRARLPQAADRPEVRLLPSDPAFRPADPATWGLTDSSRRIWGLAVRDGRLYYAVAEGPEVWSVSLAVDGTIGDDARREARLDFLPAGSEVYKLAFDRHGDLFAGVAPGARIDAPPGPRHVPFVRMRRAKGALEWSADTVNLSAGAGLRVTTGFAIGSRPSTDRRPADSDCGAMLWAAGVDSATDRPVLLGWPTTGLASPSEVVLLDGSDLTGSGIADLADPASCADAGPTESAVAVLSPPVWDGIGRGDGSGADTARPTDTGARPADATGPGGGTAGRQEGPATKVRPPAESSFSPAPSSRPPTVACVVLRAAEFQCVNGAWELELFLDDPSSRDRDSLEISALDETTVVRPHRLRKARPFDPFRISFDGTLAGRQVPLDVCLFDKADAADGRMYRCCRARLDVALPTTACLPSQSR